MKNLKIFLLIAILVSLVIGTVYADTKDKLITGNSAGVVKIGMTVSEARKALKGSEMKRTSDGEGLALIEVNQGGLVAMTLYAGEEDAEAAIDENAKIEQIEVWDSSFQTAEGVHPQMKLVEVEKKYGKFIEIQMSEIEAREYAKFAKQPKDIGLRVEGVENTAGVYTGDESITKKYTPNAFVTSIIVSK